MEVSNRDEPVGSELIDTVVSLTGMPSNLMQAELGQMIDQVGHRPDELTLDQLREVMLAYLEDLHAAFEEGEIDRLPDTVGTDTLKLVSE